MHANASTTTSTRVQSADDDSRRLQARTKGECNQGDNGTVHAGDWRRCWDDATEESNRREYTRAGVTNLFTVKLCRNRDWLRTDEVPSLMRKATPVYIQRQILSRVSVQMQTRAVQWNWMKARVDYRRPTTAPSFKWERRREVSDGNDHAVREHGEMEFTSWIQVTEVNLGWAYTDRTTSVRTKNEGLLRRRPAVTDRWRPNRIQTDRTNSRYSGGARGQGGAAPPLAPVPKKYGARSILFVLKMFLTKLHCVELCLHLKLTVGLS